MADIDASEVHQFARELHRVPMQHRVAVGKTVEHHTGQTAAKARQKAPKDRPWLGTEEGIRESFGFIGGNAVGTVYTGKDPDGEYVGFRVEYGTSVMRPQPFMVPALRQEKPQMIAEISAILGTGW